MYSEGQNVTVDGQSGTWTIIAVHKNATGTTYDVQRIGGDGGVLHNVPEGEVHPVVN